MYSKGEELKEQDSCRCCCCNLGLGSEVQIIKRYQSLLRCYKRSDIRLAMLNPRF